MAFARHRLGIDGQGVTSLVAAWGCPLDCRMCINPQCRRPETPVTRVTPEALYARARVDDLYFRATNGGVTFGGGEPLMHADFISAFRELCGPGWRLTAETCLNVPQAHVRTAAACLDEFWVDVKDMDPGIYRRYTGRDNGQMIDNLQALLNAVGPERLVARVPRIPGWNSGEDVEKSIRALKEMGVTRIDAFTYRVIE